MDWDLPKGESINGLYICLREQTIKRKKKKKNKDFYIFTWMLSVNKNGAWRVYRRIFNKLFLKCLDFTLEGILFHTFGNLEKKKYFCTILFIEI